MQAYAGMLYLQNVVPADTHGTNCASYIVQSLLYYNAILLKCPRLVDTDFRQRQPFEDEISAQQGYTTPASTTCTVDHHASAAQSA